MKKKNFHSRQENTGDMPGLCVPPASSAEPGTEEHAALLKCEKNHKHSTPSVCEILNNRGPKTTNEIFHKVNQHKSSQSASTQLLRLNHAIANSGFCSRRKADDLIFSGRVKVNNKFALQPGTKVSVTDIIEIDGEMLAARPPLTWLMLNKPIHTVCTAKDPQGRTTIFDILPETFKKIRLFTVGRLDYFSEGLLLLTNDGELAQRLAHPRHHLSKIYEVLIRGNVSESALEQMRQGMVLNDHTGKMWRERKAGVQSDAGGISVLPIKAEIKNSFQGKTLLQLELRQGINRQIRKMCAALGLTILRLRRIAQGSLSLGNLQPGAVRKLGEEEIALLRRETGLEN